MKPSGLEISLGKFLDGKFNYLNSYRAVQVFHITLSYDSLASFDIGHFIYIVKLIYVELFVI